MEHVVICGAGFAGLELATLLHEGLADRVHVTLIDASDTFAFGYSKLDVMFGRRSAPDVRLPYARIAKPGVGFVQERITAIDPSSRRVTTSGGSYDADVLVIALGADHAPEATPGLQEAGSEFYSFAGAERAREAIDSFQGGRAIIGICGPFFKCPPAPFEAAFLLDDHLRERGIRDRSSITVVSPLPMAIPVSNETSGAIAHAADERGIEAIFGELVVELDPVAKVAMCKSQRAIDFDLFLGVPKHVAPQVVVDAGLTTDGWIAVDQRHLTTSFDAVYAVGDVASAPVPRAGVFAEGQARAAYAHIAARLGVGSDPAPYDGRGACYLDFGSAGVAKVDADFLSGPEPVAPLVGPTPELVAEKAAFGETRAARWFS